MNLAHVEVGKNTKNVALIRIDANTQNKGEGEMINNKIGKHTIRNISVAIIIVGILLMGISYVLMSNSIGIRYIDHKRLDNVDMVYIGRKSIDGRNEDLKAKKEKGTIPQGEYFMDGNAEGILITDKNKIKELCNSVKWESVHVWDLHDYDYYVGFISDDNEVYCMMITEDWNEYNNEAIKAVEKIAKDGNSKSSFRYIANASTDVDYKKLKLRLSTDLNYKSYSHLNESDSPKRPYITLKYTGHVTDNDDRYMNNYKLGIFPPDNVFLNNINYMTNKKLVHHVSEVRFEESSSYFVRSIKVYLNSPADNTLLKDLQEVWKQKIEYSYPKDYDFSIISEHTLTKEEKDLLMNKYKTKIIGRRERNQLAVFYDLSGDGPTDTITLFDKYGKVVDKRETPDNSATIMSEENEIIQIRIYRKENNDYYYYFYNTRTGEISSNYENPVLIYNDKVGIRKDNLLIISNMFDSKAYYREIKRNFSEFEVLSYEIQDAELINDNELYLDYFEGPDEVEKIEIIDLK